MRNISATGTRQFLVALIVLSVNSCSYGDDEQAANSTVLSASGSTLISLPQALTEVDTTQSTVQVTLRVLNVDDTGSFLVNVYTVDDESQKYLSTFSFFPSPVSGETYEFLVPTPDDVNESDTELLFEMVSATPNTSTGDTELELIKAELIEELPQ